MSTQPISNLPINKSTDSADIGRVYFNTYYQQRTTKTSKKKY